MGKQLKRGVSLAPASFGALVGAVLLGTQVVLQWQGKQVDATLVYVGGGLLVGLPIGHFLDKKNDEKGG